MRPYLALALLGLVAASAAQAAGEVYKWTDDKGVVHYTDAPPEGREFEKKKTVAPRPATAATEATAAAETAEAPAPAAGSVGANCTAARRNIENMERFDEISMDRDGDGKPEKLTAEQKDQELKRNRALAELYCPQDDGAAKH